MPFEMNNIFTPAHPATLEYCLPPVEAAYYHLSTLRSLLQTIEETELLHKILVRSLLLGLSKVDPFPVLPV